MLTLLGGSAAWVFFRDSKKRQEAAKADKEEAEANIKQIEANRAKLDVVTKFADEWKSLYDVQLEKTHEQEKEIDSLNKKIDELYKQINRLRDEVAELNKQCNTLSMQREEAVYHKCVRKGCDFRLPPHPYDNSVTEDMQEQMEDLSRTKRPERMNTKHFGEHDNKE